MQYFNSSSKISGAAILLFTFCIVATLVFLGKAEEAMKFFSTGSLMGSALLGGKIAQNIVETVKKPK